MPPIGIVSRRSLAVIAALILLTAYGVYLSATTVPIRFTPETPAGLTVDEATYYGYVAPRLDRLVVEMDAVVELVRTRSRNVVTLTVHGNRIEALSRQIAEFGTRSGVPDRFAMIHMQILRGSEEAMTAMEQARTALQRFDFSTIPTLIPQFEGGAKTIHQARNTLATAAGATPPVP
jgi:hypothetical protein